ncbi:hypothetical protein [Pedobacter mendelii]|nr:hypothetical protein [Pedobacter mendelii]
MKEDFYAADGWYLPPFLETILQVIFFERKEIEIILGKIATSFLLVMRNN